MFSTRLSKLFVLFLVAGFLVTGFPVQSAQADKPLFRLTAGERSVVRHQAAQDQGTQDQGTTPEPPMLDDAQEEIIEEFVDDGFVGAPELLEFEEGEPWIEPYQAAGMWLDFEYLLLWRSGQRTPPLVITEPNANLVLPNATILLGNGRIEDGVDSAGRVHFGKWVDATQTLGIGASFMATGKATDRFSFGQPQFNTLAIPHLNEQNQETASVVANLPNLQGSVGVVTESATIVADAYIRRPFFQTPGMQMSMIYGYQFSRIDESLEIQAMRQGAPNISSTDIFSTQNEYHAAHLGFQTEYRRGAWGLDLGTKFALGTMRQQVAIRGFQVDNTGAVVNAGSGLFAHAGNNAGVREQDEFSYMQMADVRLKYWTTPRLSWSIGYSLMYWSSVVQPGDHIDRQIDSGLLGNQAGPTARPIFRFADTSFVLQGINFAMEFDY